MTALYSIGTVCRWLGNSVKVADAHYLTALETDFDRAAKVGALIQNPEQAQNQAQQTETNRVEPRQSITRDMAETLGIAENAKKFPEACKSQGG